MEKQELVEQPKIVNQPPAGRDPKPPSAHDQVDSAFAKFQLEHFHNTELTNKTSELTNKLLSAFNELKESVKKHLK